MRHFWIRPAIVGLLALLMIGCDNGPDLTGSTDTGISPDLAACKTVVAQDAALVSATLHLWAEVPSSGTVTVHRITAPWEEYSVTWNNFGGAYDAETEASFQPSSTGWYEVDVTELVTSWLNGDAENYGLLLRQRPLEPPRTMFWSREEVAYAPHLEVCTTTETGKACTTLVSIADAYIFESNPDVNKGVSPGLFTGWVSLVDLDQEKQSLIRFDLPDAPQGGGCTSTIGYWKRHAGFGPQDDVVTPLLPIWLGDANGRKSIHVTDARIAFWLLRQRGFGSPSNGITKLYAQLLAAKLNAANGADDSAVADVISNADAFLAEHDWKDWRRLPRRGKNAVLRWKSTLDRYNNGLIGPGHCD